jgi:hypothetical protein
VHRALTVLSFLLLAVVAGCGSPRELDSIPPATTSATAPTTAPPTATAPAPATPAPAAGTFSDGTYEVGADIPPGKYRTTGPDPSDALPMCYTARLKDTSGDPGSIISNNIVKGPGVFTVKSSDNAVEFSGGCTWTKAG